MISISNAFLSYADNCIFSDLNFNLLEKKWNCILGATGCGKSSLLKLLAGILPQQAHCSYQSNFTSFHKQVTYMSQSDSLLPWLSVLDNVFLSYKLSKKSITTQDYQKALKLLNFLGLGRHVDVLPKSLSGGMKQKVALARTFMCDQPIVLMDEPFSALDITTKCDIQQLAFDLFADKTVVLVTHDPCEALRLGSKVFLFSNSKLTSIPLPKEIPLRSIYTEEMMLYQKYIVARLKGVAYAN